MSYANIQAQQASLSYIAVWGASTEVAFTAPSVPCPRLSKYLISLDEIKFDAKTFQLNNPISVTLYQEDGLWYCEHEECEILSVGNTAAEAVCSFSEDFSVLWDEIAQSPDDSLTIEAQRVKACLLSMVKSVKMR